MASFHGGNWPAVHRQPAFALRCVRETKKPVFKPDYSTGNEAIKREWAYWRRTAKLYGFGRHQLQPMRENGEALGRYLGEYLRKDWDSRLPEDKGARCVRYFGHWSIHRRRLGEHKEKPPNKGRFVWLTVRSRVWREMVKQTIIVLNYGGAKLTPDNIKNVMGSRWAWKMAKLFPSVAFIAGDWQPKEIQDGIEDHNLEVRVRWLADGGDQARQCWWYVTELNLDHFRPSPAWIRANEELELAKECEAIMQRGLNDLAKRQRKQKEKMRMLREVAELFHKRWKQNGDVPADNKNKEPKEIRKSNPHGQPTDCTHLTKEEKRMSILDAP